MMASTTTTTASGATSSTYPAAPQQPPDDDHCRPLYRLCGHAVGGCFPPEPVHEPRAVERGGDAAACIGVRRDVWWTRVLGLSFLSPWVAPLRCHGSWLRYSHERSGPGFSGPLASV
jgi:hypothetical protein